MSANASNHIPEDIQRPWRQRLRLLRMHNKRGLNSFQCIHSGTLSVYETRDISTMTMGTLVALGIDYGLSAKELFDYLDADDESITLIDRTPDRVASMVRQLPSDQQEIVVAVVQAILSLSQLKIGSRPVAQPPAIGDPTLKELILRVQRSNNLRADLGRLDTYLNGDRSSPS